MFRGETMQEAARFIAELLFEGQKHFIGLFFLTSFRLEKGEILGGRGMEKASRCLLPNFCKKPLCVEPFSLVQRLLCIIHQGFEGVVSVLHSCRSAMAPEIEALECKEKEKRSGEIGLDQKKAQGKE